MLDAHKPPLPLRVLGERLAVCRLEPDAEVPAWATVGEIFSVTRTPDELSVVCPEEVVPPGTTSEGGWRALEVEGTLDFSLVGVLASLTVPLAEGGISMFAISTYRTDYLLVREAALDLAVAALRERGHRVS
ncbi:MAG TPA: ACT domain-containing protein [Rubrobacteraceae bacterium]|nr:ACT domain-containing protein [Rubrobacteraceae bacterium]